MKQSSFVNINTIDSSHMKTIKKRSYSPNSVRIHSKNLQKTRDRDFDDISSVRDSCGPSNGSTIYNETTSRYYSIASITS